MHFLKHLFRKGPRTSNAPKSPYRVASTRPPTPPPPPPFAAPEAAAPRPRIGVVFVLALLNAVRACEHVDRLDSQSARPALDNRAPPAQAR